MVTKSALWLFAVQKLFLAAGVACAFAVGTSAWSQSSDDVHVVPRIQPPAASDESGPPGISLHTRPLRADVDLVLVPVTVSDPMNHPVLNLRQQDFKLYEGTAQQQVRYFSHEDAPISIALVLDCSASMKNKIEYEYQALQEFLSNANSEDEYFAVTVSNKPTLIATASDSVGTMEDRLVGRAGHKAAPRCSTLFIWRFRSCGPPAINAGRYSSSPTAAITPVAIPATKSSDSLTKPMFDLCHRHLR